MTDEEYNRLSDDDKRHFIRRIEDKECFKQAIKEAAKEWLQEQFASFGKWTAIGIASATFYGVVKIIIVAGWWPK